MAVIIVPKPLREKLGEEAVDSLVELLNKSDEKLKEDIIVLVEEKFEKRLSEELSKVRVEISEVKAGLEEKISEVRVEISEVKADLIKWMFIFWVGQIGVILGILFAFFK